MKRNSFISKIYRQETIDKIAGKCILLGSRYNYNPEYLITYRFLTSIVILLLLIFILPYGLIIGPVLIAGYYYLLEYFFLDYRIRIRKKELEKDALYFFEVLSLTIDTGKSLRISLEMTVNTINNEISYEFKKALEENKLSRNLIDSLKDMKKRIPSTAINSVILNLIEANKYGNNITDTLKSQINYLQEKQLQQMKGYIAKLPIKISAISVIFFIPIMLLIVLSPVIIKLIIG